MKNYIIWKFLLLAGCLWIGQAAVAQSTAFTYQGALNDGGAPANGGYDLSFAAYDASINGDLVSEIVTNFDVSVSNGLFSTTVDFGSEVFTGGDLWLEIAVSTNGGDTFATVAPRQMFTPVPYALYAQAAGNASSVASSAVSVTQLNTVGAPSSGQVLAFNGSQLTWQDPVVGGATDGWSLAGNVGTSPSANFLGTLDNQPLELRVGGARALRLEPTTSGAPNVIGGASVNYVSNGVVGATIAGGGALNYSGSVYSNTVTADFGAIGGGVNNIAGGEQSFVGGGFENTASGYISTVAGGAYNLAITNEASVLGGAFNVASGIGSTISGGGYDGHIASGNGASGEVSSIGGGLGNAADGYASAISGGYANNASGLQAFVGGGSGNVASGNDLAFYENGQVLEEIEGNSTVGGGNANSATATCATVPGGAFNTASGDFSFAAGFHAVAANAGTFVWADDSSSSSFSSSSVNQFLIRATNGVGIGTSQTPIGGFRVASGGLAVTGASSPHYPGSAGVFLEKGNNNGNIYAFDYVADATLPLCLNSPGGNVGVGTATPQSTLDVNGTTRTGAIIITGGSDVAEPFKTGPRLLEKGSVVVIDPEHPGELKASTRAYDPCVAGIVSGANGVNPGIALHQAGVLDGDQNVALSGRVYVLADASKGEIKPGDCLTTSSNPGHAMKVKDHARAQGAIIGKAMTSLHKGTGLVLVLVTLQ